MPKKKTSAVSGEVTTFSAIVPHDNNANVGTERGNYMIEQSVRDNGLGRGIVLDRNHKIIGGNHIYEKAGELGFDKVVLFPTDGDTLIATVRTDCDLDAEPGSEEFVRAHELAIADNRTSQTNTNLQGVVIADYATKGVDLDKYFKPVELDSLFAAAPTAFSDGSGEEGGKVSSGGDTEESDRQPPAGTLMPLAISLNSTQLKQWKAYKKRCGLKKDGPAFLKLLESADGG